MNGYCPLASGSRGNCIYLATPKVKVLIDAGLSGKATAERLAPLDVDVRDLNAILITHEHTDHIQGLKTLALRHHIPVYCNQETAKGIVDAIGDCPHFKIFCTGEPFSLGDMEVHPFSVQHDTSDPVAFAIRIDGLKCGFCTDLGHVSSLVRAQLQQCDMLYVESNHQPSMVHASARPAIYKQRVLGRSGHLSNEACGELLRDVSHEKLRHVHLAHLSSECNTPETALEVVRGCLLEASLPIPSLSIAWQDRVSDFIPF